MPTLTRTFLPLLIASLVLPVASGPAMASPVGPNAAACAAGQPALIVRVSGFKKATGRLRLKLYEADARSYLGKTSQIDRIVVPVRHGGTIDVCVPVPAAGGYVVSVLHDINGDNESEMSDGGGVTGNPRPSLGDLLAKRKPSLTQVTVRVGAAPVVAPVRLLYRQGLSVGPVRNPA